MNNKLKFLIILSLIIFFLIAILFFPKKKVSPPEEESHGLLMPLTKEDIDEIKTLREDSLSDIENYIPDNANFIIKYDKDIVGEPIFEIVIDANNWDEFISIGKKAMQIFKERGVDPCSYPLSEKINITVKDWSKFDRTSYETEERICP